MGRMIMKNTVSTPKTIARKKVAAYARVSSGKDAMLHSLSAQVSYYSELIQNNPEWEYAGVYADEAITGTKIERAQFQKLLEECRHKRVDMIITKSISRFARNTLALLEVVRELKEINVDVYFEKENIHSISGDGELMLSILVSFAQAESLSVSDNCKWRIRKSFAEGELVNLRFMFGFNISNKDITINPDEAKIVKKIFNDYLEGKGTTSIAKELRELNINRPRGGIWTSERVAEILKNEKHIGNSLLQKKHVSDHLSKKLVKNKGELPQYYVENSHSAIIDKELFEKAQKILAKKREQFAGKTSNKPSPFTSKIVCGQCGKNYKRKVNHERVYWGCSTYLCFGKKACPAGQIPENILIEKANEVIGIDVFHKEAFDEEISHIEAKGQNTLNFVFKNGDNIEMVWQHKPRSDSWNDAARQKARERELQKRREAMYDTSESSHDYSSEK